MTYLRISTNMNQIKRKGSSPNTSNTRDAKCNKQGVYVCFLWQKDMIKSTSLFSLFSQNFPESLDIFVHPFVFKYFFGTFDYSICVLWFRIFFSQAIFPVQELIIIKFKCRTVIRPEGERLHENRHKTKKKAGNNILKNYRTKTRKMRTLLLFVLDRFILPSARNRDSILSKI